MAVSREKDVLVCPFGRRGFAVLLLKLISVTRLESLFDADVQEFFRKEMYIPTFENWAICIKSLVPRKVGIN
jgi:hypothetical protein